MTDNDIIKALECCANANNVLVAGERFEDKGLCCLFKDALDLINRQKAEIENQNAKIDNLIEWLDYRAETIRGLNDELKIARSEAITEVGDRLAVHFGTFTDNDTIKVLDLFKLINQIAKELKGEQ